MVVGSIQWLSPTQCSQLTTGSATRNRRSSPLASQLHIAVKSAAPLVQRTTSGECPSQCCPRQRSWRTGGASRPVVRTPRLKSRYLIPDISIGSPVPPPPSCGGAADAPVRSVAKNKIVPNIVIVVTCICFTLMTMLPVFVLH